MKRTLFFMVLGSMLLLSSCGTSSHYASSYNQLDGIYYRPQQESKEAIRANDSELETLVAKTGERVKRFTDTIVLRNNQELTIDTKPGERYAILLDGNGADAPAIRSEYSLNINIGYDGWWGSDPFDYYYRDFAWAYPSHYYRHHPWRYRYRYAYYHPWFDPWYPPYYDPWYDPWYYTFHDPWFNPWYPGYYPGYFPGCYPGYYPGYFPGGHFSDRKVIYGKRGSDMKRPVHRSDPNTVNTVHRQNTGIAASAVSRNAVDRSKGNPRYSRQNSVAATTQNSSAVDRSTAGRTGLDRSKLVYRGSDLKAVDRRAVNTTRSDAASQNPVRNSYNRSSIQTSRNGSSQLYRKSTSRRTEYTRTENGSNAKRYEPQRQTSSRKQYNSYSRSRSSDFNRSTFNSSSTVNRTTNSSGSTAIGVNRGGGGGRTRR